MKKSTLALVVVALMLMSSLVGCQSAAPAATTAPAATSAQPAATTAAASEAPPTVGPAVKLTGITTTQAADNPFPYPIEGVMAKAANVEIEWQHVGLTDWAAQKPVMLASGELPDIWFAASLTDAEANSGVFLDMAPLIDKTVNIKKFFDTIPEAKAMCLNPEGTIYGLPSRHAVRPMAGDTLYVNKAWCDKLNIKLPTTLDEYEAMLKAFVTKDPNGNGKNDEVGYTGYFKLPFTIPGAQVSSMGTLQCFLPSFGVMVSQGFATSTLCMVIDGKVVFAPTMDGYKQALIWLNKLYSEKLIDNELFNMDPPAMMAKLGGTPVCTAGSGSAWTKEAFCLTNVDQFAYVEPLKNGPDGPQYWRSDYGFAMQLNTAAIAATCKDPEAAMRFYDQCYDEKNSLQICYGSEGVGTAFKDGKPSLIPGPDGSTSDAFRFTCASELGPGWASDEFDKSVTGVSDIFKKHDASQIYSKFFKPEWRYPTVKWDKATADELATLQTDINTYVDTANVNFIMKGGVEAGWQAYVDKLNKMGLERLMQIYTKGYEGSAK